ncbi:phage integrase family protein [Synechococcus sp. A15-24]|nr:phage integrase family protein [Synechococcus sp. A15-24]
MASTREQWFVTCRKLLKAEQGFGWSIRDHRGTVQLTRRFEDGSRSSAYLPLPWTKASSTPILNWVKAVRELMEVQQLSLSKAVKLYGDSLDDPKKPSASVAGVTGQKAWESALASFMATKAGNRPNTLKWTSARLNKLLQTLESAPKPRNGEAALQAYAEQHFYDTDGNVSVSAGGQGRIRALKDCSAFLKWSVERQMVPPRFAPPSGSQGTELMRQLTGTASAQVEADKTTPPLKSKQISDLLDELESAGRHDLKLCVGLIAYLGLRPGEIAVLQVQDGQATVGHIKRNHRTMHKPIKAPDPVMPLAIAGRPVGEAEQMLTAFESGLVKLPKAVRNQISTIEKKNSFQGVGGEVGQQLNRFPYWRDVIKAGNANITANSFRHGWAYRAHIESDNHMHERVAAKWLRHSLLTHLRHYGHWLDRESMDAALKKTNAGVAVAKGQT